MNVVYLHILLFLILEFFFFKQKTAYEIGSGLVGSEMCIRDRYYEYYGLTPDKLDHAKSDALIMHPGPMNLSLIHI